MVKKKAKTKKKAKAKAPTKQPRQPKKKVKKKAKRAKAKPKKKTGRPVTLAKEIAVQLQALWQLSGDDTLTDLEIIQRIGITKGQLDSWLNKKTEVVLVKKHGPVTLRSIRTRAKATTKSSYLQRLYKQMVSAENAGDYKTSSYVLQWLMERQFPLSFGNRIKIEAGKPEMSDEQCERIRDSIMSRFEEITK